MIEKNGGYVYKILLDKKKKSKQKTRLRNSVSTANKITIFFKSATITWSYKLYTNKKIVDDTIPTHPIKKLPETYNEKLLKKSELTMEEKKHSCGKLNFQFSQFVFEHHR